ncbi:hypothetical protein BKA57DRAFT_318450 [Linnemannia elongata]|nr:hypothetical protein BKA57DRAFT_318450 [Linnemannia elongata]
MRLRPYAITTFCSLLFALPSKGRKISNCQEVPYTLQQTGFHKRRKRANVGNGMQLCSVSRIKGKETLTKGATATDKLRKKVTNEDRRMFFFLMFMVFRPTLTFFSLWEIMTTAKWKGGQQPSSVDRR